MTFPVSARGRGSWLVVRKTLSRRREPALAVASFVLPLVVWSALSYLPFLWHPYVKITHPGDGEYAVGARVERATFAEEVRRAQAAGGAAPRGVAVNPVYFPAPHEVAEALYTAFLTPPRLPTEPWLHESLWHSLQVIFWGFLLSSIVGIPLGILGGTFSFFSKLTEPFIEFFRYLPAPAFGALGVAVLGIYDAPKIAIIFIGTFFQMVLMFAEDVRRVPMTQIEAAQTMGATRGEIVNLVLIPSAKPALLDTLRVTMGWAWTYLVVAELVAANSGLGYAILRAQRFLQTDKIFAGIIIIGLIGLILDQLFRWLHRAAFPWLHKR